MKVIVNGVEKTLKKGATLKDAVSGEPYVKGSLVSVHLSTERLVTESNDFEIKTNMGSMTVHLDDSDDAEKWKSIMDILPGKSTRWVTHNIAAFGVFSTDIEVNRDSRMYRKYDCFFSLGGFDNNTTYMMIARDDHRWSYGAGTGRIGRITRGRHIVDALTEGDAILEITPQMSETSTENVHVTNDLTYPIDEGYRIETYAFMKLNVAAPESTEHLLIISDKGYINISDETGSYAACSDDVDVTIAEETHAVREPGRITVRYAGEGKGRVFIYKERRQLVTGHNCAGVLKQGSSLSKLAKAGDMITVVTDPKRILSVGMTQADAAKFLANAGVKQVRTGDVSDDAIVAEQTPERTVLASAAGTVETFGVQKDRIFRISLDRRNASGDVHYFEKVTGLSHKPIGKLKVHFTFEDLPMVTFEGDEIRGKSLYPQDPFKKCKRGDLGLTNQARPHHGLIGLRLSDSKEYGPTGEEPYGTNIFGKFADDIDRLMGGLEEEQIVYITERKL